MNRNALSAVVAFAALFLIMPNDVSAQMRRSGGDGPGPSGPPPKGIPRNAERPYEGVWDGSFTISGPQGEDRIPVVMVFTLAESPAAGGKYDGFTVLPNGARAPHDETGLTNGAIHWQQSNSGGGFWLYTGKIVSTDSIAGTVALKDWPQLPAGAKPPTGTLSLVRRKPDA